MGYNRATRGYLSGSSGGHASISDDGNGNVVVANGKRLLLGTGSSVGAPIISLNAAPTHGYHLVPGNNTLCANGADKLIASATVVQIKGAKLSLFSGVTSQYETTADQSITGTGSTVSPNGRHIKITSDGVYTLTNAMAAGVDGQPMTVENVSGNDVTLQEGILVPANDAVPVVYSTDAAKWLEI